MDYCTHIHIVILASTVNQQSSVNDSGRIVMALLIIILLTGSSLKNKYIY